MSRRLLNSAKQLNKSCEPFATALYFEFGDVPGCVHPLPAHRRHKFDARRERTNPEGPPDFSGDRWRALRVASVRVGDYKSKPTLVADANFQGIAVIDADPYIPGEVARTATNFFRSVRNSVIDVTAMPPDQFGLQDVESGRYKAPGCIHGERLRRLHVRPLSMSMICALPWREINRQLHSGAFGMWISNYQFTIRNVKITNAVSAIYQQWNWGFTWENIQISNCQVGFDLNTGGLTQPTQMSSSQPSSLAGSVILDKVKLTGISTANIQDSAGTVVAANAANMPQWFQGNVYLEFFSIMTIGLGANGDGVSDDTVTINTFLSKYSGCAEREEHSSASLLCLRYVEASKPYQPHPTSTAAIGTADERHRPGEAVVNEGEAH
ncbi:hypothetical protein B0H14DRAFT_2595714 [Mycena olivaceomarginata]|nr:hypothetical protein B0H14DRAFT_2595714 [Mycena olivaceomarginata]